MNKFYVANFADNSGIARYAEHFYRFVLKDQGYTRIDSGMNRVSVMTTISSRDVVHFEIGIFQTATIDLFFTMLNAEYQNLSVTLHDPPLLRYPFRRFRNPILNAMSKLSDRYLNQFQNGIDVLKKISHVYVLSMAGAGLMRSRYKMTNVHFLPHILDETSIQFPSATSGQDLLYFGFIGPNKGLSYAIRLHEALRKYKPELRLMIIGSAIGRQQAYLRKLLANASDTVSYLGFLPEKALNKIFDEAGFVILPFKSYQFYTPFSGSILFSMMKNKIVFSTKVNAVPELVKHGQTGFFLSMNIREDRDLLLTVLNDVALQRDVRQHIAQLVADNHSRELVKKTFLESLKADLNEVVMTE